MTCRPFVIIESPYAASSTIGKGTNISFAKRVCRWAISDGYTPFASHMFYPQFLDDLDAEERRLGIEMGFQIGKAADEIWFCVLKGRDHSPGMERAFDHWSEVALKHDLIIKFIEFNQSGQRVTEKVIWPKEK